MLMRVLGRNETAFGLHYRTLSNNSLSGRLPELRGPSSLEELNLDQNQFNGSIPQSWSSISNLQYLSLASNTLSGILPATWGALQSLYLLDLHDNRISGVCSSSYSERPGDCEMSPGKNPMHTSDFGDAISASARLLACAIRYHMCNAGLLACRLNSLVLESDDAALRFELVS